MWLAPWEQVQFLLGSPRCSRQLELQERKTGEPPMRWEQGTLVVRLPPGEQCEIEMSSTLTEDFFDHFALRNDLSKAATEAGRNPLITPARVIRFVHAVRRPLWNPDPSLRLEPGERTIGQTSAFLNPRSLTFHAGSTSQFEVSAEWDEVPDEDTTPPRIKSLIQVVRVDPGDSELRETIRP